MRAAEPLPMSPAQNGVCEGRVKLSWATARPGGGSAGVFEGCLLWRHYDGAIDIDEIVGDDASLTQRFMPTTPL
jgi:hypothetical protein